MFVFHMESSFEYNLLFCIRIYCFLSNIQCVDIFMRLRTSYAKVYFMANVLDNLAIALLFS